VLSWWLFFIGGRGGEPATYCSTTIRGPLAYKISQARIRAVVTVTVTVNLDLHTKPSFPHSNGGAVDEIRDWAAG
jgi:hypothetical protein